jgi:ribosomal protein S18 acetylase RimI-like enzyme
MIEIRRASESNAQILADLGKNTFIETFAKDNRKEDMDMYVAETFGVDKQLKELRDPNRWIAIAWSGNLAAGFLHLVKSNPDPSVTGPKPIELLRLYVDSRWHGKGVGAALMERTIQIAREEGFQTLWLGVWERNFRAQAFYNKYEFAAVGRHTFRLGTDDQIDFIMARTI